MPNDTIEKVELVITAPEPFGNVLMYRMRCRSTLGVLTQLVAQSRKSVIISAPYFQEGYGLSDGPLADSLRSALMRGVNADVLSTGKSLGTLNVALLRREAKGILRLFRPQANIKNARILGSHAKFCVVDGDRAYVGSANMTGPGLADHFEMGLLIGGKIPRQIEEFWNYSIEIGLFKLIG
jgi:phosphatidylserine/phosphatidylglycerophosphate/cardiolipin synthase-like enzyme